MPVHTKRKSKKEIWAKDDHQLGISYGKSVQERYHLLSCDEGEHSEKSPKEMAELPQVGIQTI